MKPEKKEKPWFMNWFDENYRMLYRHRNTDDAQTQFQLILNTLKPKKSAAILDLGCGEGRYTALFGKKGYAITGLDLSETLIRLGKQRNSQLNLIVGDMRAIPGHFDIILSLFTSFGYLDSDPENEAVLQSVYSSLNDHGIFWLDFLNPAYIETHLVPETLTPITPGIEVWEKRKIEKGRIIKDICFRNRQTTIKNIKNEAEQDFQECKQKDYKESVRLFSREQLAEMFLRNHFEVFACFGDYQGQPWHSLSERTILVGRKK